MPRCGITLIVVAAALVAAAPSRAQAQAGLRDSLIAQVLRANPGLSAKRYEALAAKARMRQMSSWDDPTFAVELYNTPVTSLNPFRDGEETDYSLQQMIPWPGKKSRMTDAAGAGARAMELGVDEEKRALIARVKKMYVDLYFAQQRLLVNDTSRAILKKMIDVTSAQIPVGRASQADLLKLRVQFSQLDNERAILIHDAHVPEAMINMLRDAPMDSLGLVPEPPLTLFDFDVHALVDSAFEHRYALKQAAMEVAMAKADQEAVARERMPDIMLRGMYKYMAMMPNSYAIMVGVNVPIAPWSSGKYDARDDEQEARVHAAEAMRHDRENMVEYEVHDSWVHARTFWEEMTRYRLEIIPQATQALESSMAGFSTGQTSFLSLLDSFRMITMFKMEFLMSQATYLMHIADLELATGMTLDGGAQ